MTFRTSYDRPTVRGSLLSLGRRRHATKVVDAVQDVSLTVQHGTVLGVVGANGAGKSTLVRAIAGIIPPTTGRITVDGEISTLLALGAGFNRELTGRDNVLLGGLAAGLPRAELLSRCDEIADFAGLQDVLDLPMRTYSSGMYSRLAFAVAVTLDPDILLVDEALATGDSAFKTKSYARIRELCAAARTIVVVSHSLGSIEELCTHAIWMHGGRLVFESTPSEVVARYKSFTTSGRIPATRSG